MSDGWSLNGRFALFVFFLCATSQFFRSSRYIGPSEIRPMVHKWKIFIWAFLYQSSSDRCISNITAKISPSFMQLISFFPVGWSTKYYLHHLATLISADDTSHRASKCFTACAMLPLWVIILSHMNLGICWSTNITTGPKRISINLNGALLSELGLCHEYTHAIVTMMGIFSKIIGNNLSIFSDFYTLL